MSKAANFRGEKMSRRNIQRSIRGRGDDGKRCGWSALAAVLCALLVSGCVAPVKDTSRTFQTVVIDAGHGGHDNGARSRWAGSEKAHTLAVARRLEPKLRAAGFRTVMTRSSDRFIELNDRPGVSNRQNNAIFVSIHFNHSRARRIHGAEVYYKSAASREIAERILRKVAALPGGSSRGVKRSNFRVLKLNRYPAVLVECGYLSHRAEGSRSATATQHERIAEAIARAITEQHRL